MMEMLLSFGIFSYYWGGEISSKTGSFSGSECGTSAGTRATLYSGPQSAIIGRMITGSI
jgi:hypothetical protein